MGAIHLCGSDERERWLPAMARMEMIGTFGLAEPDVGSAISSDLATSARSVRLYQGVAVGISN